MEKPSGVSMTSGSFLSAFFVSASWMPLALASAARTEVFSAITDAVSDSSKVFVGVTDRAADVDDFMGDTFDFIVATEDLATEGVAVFMLPADILESEVGAILDEMAEVEVFIVEQTADRSPAINSISRPKSSITSPSSV